MTVFFVKRMGKTRGHCSRRLRNSSTIKWLKPSDVAPHSSVRIHWFVRHSLHRLWGQFRLWHMVIRLCQREPRGNALGIGCVVWGAIWIQGKLKMTMLAQAILSALWAYHVGLFSLYIVSTIFVSYTQWYMLLRLVHCISHCFMNAPRTVQMRLMPFREYV